MKRILEITLILAVLLLGACAAGGPSTRLKVEMTDFAFTPDHFSVPAGQEITVDIAHHGLVVHEFIIMQLGADAGSNFDEDDKLNVHTRVEVPPGHSQSFTFVAPLHPGEYQIVCGIAGHIESGMTATLTVVE